MSISDASSLSIAEDSFAFANARKNKKGQQNQLYKQKLRKIDQALIETKQHVVKHILKVRALEKAKNQAIAVNFALQRHLGGASGRTPCQILDDIKTLDSVRVPTDERDIRRIELAARISCVGVGRIIQQALENYSDRELENKLSTLRIDPSTFEENIFAKIVVASSNAALGPNDAALMLARCRQTMRTRNVDTATLWDLLQRALRKRIQMMHLALCVLRSPDYAFRNSRNLLDSSSFKFNGAHKKEMTRNIRIVNKLSDYERSSSVSETTLESLSKSLKISKLKELEAQDKISSDINLLVASQTVPSHHFKGRVNAMMVAKKMRFERLDGIYSKILLKSVNIALVKWKKSTDLLNTEEVCKTFVRHLATHQLFTFVEYKQKRTIYKALEKYKSFTRYYQSKEQLAAVLEIQRYWRGGHSRSRLRRDRLDYYATQVQKHARRFIRRHLLHEKKRSHKVKEAVLSIEKTWKSFRWKRTLAKLFKLQKLNRQVASIQSVFRGHQGRKRFGRLYLAKKRKIGALRFQSLYRRYKAVLRVSLLLWQRQRKRAAIVLQRIWRGKLGRNSVSIKRKIRRSAQVIQYFFLIITAIRRTNQIRRTVNAKVLQRVTRGRQGRKLASTRRIELRKKNERVKDAYEKITAIVIGHLCRNRWRSRVEAHLRKRRMAASTLQVLIRAIYLGLLARRRVTLLRAVRMQHVRQCEAAVLVQRIARGKLGRMRADRHRKKHLLQMELASRKPYYYRMREEYYKTQNLFHRPYLIKIQCAIRQKLARQHLHMKYRDRHALRIQLMFRRFKARRIYRQRKAEFYKSAKVRFAKAVQIQRIVRGFIARYPSRAKKQITLVKWFLMENKVRKNIAGAMNNFRARKQRDATMVRAAIKIQTPVRGKLVRKQFKRNYKRLVRERKARTYQRCVKAATRIQCLFRKWKAKALVEKRRAEKEAIEAERREWEAIEESLVGLHEDFMTELMVLRCQTAGRGMLAKTLFIKKVAKFRENKLLEEQKQRVNAATMIQKLARGVESRTVFKRELVNLKRAVRQRQFCVECENVVATKRCRQCKDRFCNNCYQRIHARGARRGHTFETIRLDELTLKKLQSADYNVVPVGGTQALGAAPAAVVKGNKNKKDWEEFYDSSAKAKYWFNKTTGEASWISPF